MNKQLTVNKLKRLTLEDISQRKQELLDEINIQKDIIVYSTQRVFSPFTSNEENSGGGMFKKLNTGLAIFDGVMIGYKIIKNIKKFFWRR